MLNGAQLAKWLSDVPGSLLPPGTEQDFIEAQQQLHQHTQSISIILNHRFAFYFWGEFFQERKIKHLNGGKSPLLVSIDSHNDVGDIGTLSESDQQELRQLDLNNKTELGLYCWLRLNANNDAHIRPALFMNFFSDALVLLKKPKTEESELLKNTEIQDLSEGIHQVKYFYDQKELIYELEKHKNVSIYLDIDLDYFIKEGSQLERGTGELTDDMEIRGILNLSEKLMSQIYPRIVGITIALEPVHCGGMKNSLHALDILNNEFFQDTLLTNHCKWNK